MNTYGIILTGLCCTALLACTKTIDAGSEKSGKIRVRIEAEMNELPSTRTFIEDEEAGKVGWNATGEVVKVIESYDKDSGEHIAVDTDGYSLDGDKATFSFTMTPNLEKAIRYYTAVYPSTAYNPASNSTAGSFRLTLPSSQTPAQNSWDPKADLMRSQATSTELADSPTLPLIFTRIVSVNKMMLRGLTAGEKISAVTVTASKALAGNCTTNLTGSYVKTSTAVEKTVTLNLSGREVPESGELVCWFTSYPAAFGEGDTMTVTAATDEGCTYTKEIAFSADRTLEFKGGEGTRFSVSGWTKMLRTSVDFTTAELPAQSDAATDELSVTDSNGYVFKVSGQIFDGIGNVIYYKRDNALYFAKSENAVNANACGFVELPAPKGYTLKTVIINDVKSSKTYRVYDNKKSIYEYSNNEYLGTKQNDKSGNATLTVKNAEEGKKYWLCCPVFTYVRTLEVIYE